MATLIRQYPRHTRYRRGRSPDPGAFLERYRATSLPLPLSASRRSTPCRASWRGRKAPWRYCGSDFNRRRSVRDPRCWRQPLPKVKHGCGGGNIRVERATIIRSTAPGVSAATHGTLLRREPNRRLSFGMPVPVIIPLPVFPAGLLRSEPAAGHFKAADAPRSGRNPPISARPARVLHKDQ